MSIPTAQLVRAHLVQRLLPYRTALALVVALLLLAGGREELKGQTATPTPQSARGVVLYNSNLRAGPGTAHRVVGKARAGELLTLVRSNARGDWYLLAGDERWIAAFLVELTPGSSLSTATPALSATASRTLLQPLATRTPTVSGTRVATQRVLRNANLRAGPGTNYAIVGGARGGDQLAVAGRTSDGGWIRLANGSWIAAFLIEEATMPLPTVAPTIVAGLPTAVPTATPPPAPTQPPLAPATAEPTVQTENRGSATFVVTERRLWNAWENGGSMDGPSVHCGQGRTLVVNVLDENSNRINGVAVQAEYGAKEVHVTGAQGKGDGVAEFVLGGGQNVQIIRDADGSPVTSESATGLSTDPRNIDQASLLGAGYCQDEESCRTFANNLSCIGHFSWTVTFERRR